MDGFGTPSLGCGIVDTFATLATLDSELDDREGVESGSEIDGAAGCD